MFDLLYIQSIILLPEIYLRIGSLSVLLFILLYNNKSRSKVKRCNRRALYLIRRTRMLVLNSPILSNSERFIIDNKLLVITYILLFFSRVYIYKIYPLMIEDLRYTYELIILVLTSVVGMMLLIKANDLIRMYLAIELQRMAMYIIASYSRSNNRAEAGLKYYIMGGLASRIQILGIALIYGSVGRTNYLRISYCRNDLDSTNIGLLLVCIGLVFKLGGAPFHRWLADVYEGSPLAGTAFFTLLPKIAVFRALSQICGIINDNTILTYFLLFCGVRSLIVGALGCLTQINLKRFIAYSTINNIGFILVALRCGANDIALLYLTIYTINSLPVFRSLIEIKFQLQLIPYYLIKSLNNLKSCPEIGYAIVIIMLSFAGTPPLIGFYPKFLVLNVVMNNNNLLIAFITLRVSVVAAFYYIRLIQVIKFNNNKRYHKGLNLGLVVISKASINTSLVLSYSFWRIISSFILYQELILYFKQYF